MTSNNDDLYQMNRKELVDEFLDRVGHASPDKLNEACQKWLARGGKFALLARAIMGENISQDELDKFKN